GRVQQLGPAVDSPIARGHGRRRVAAGRIGLRPLPFVGLTVSQSWPMSTAALAPRLPIFAVRRRSRLLTLESDERLVALVRDGHEAAFEVLVERYEKRLLVFCRNMLRSSEDARDMVQDVFANAHRAMLADERPIHV